MGPLLNLDGSQYVPTSIGIHGAPSQLASKLAFGLLTHAEAQRRLHFYQTYALRVDAGLAISLPMSDKASAAGGHIFAYPEFNHLAPDGNIKTYQVGLSAAEFGNIVVLRQESVLATYDALMNDDGNRWEFKTSIGTQSSIGDQVSKANKQADHLWLITQGCTAAQVRRWAAGRLLKSQKHGTPLALEQIYCVASDELTIISTANMHLKRRNQPVESWFRWWAVQSSCKTLVTTLCK